MDEPLRYHDFTLRLQPDGAGGITTLIQHAPTGGGSAPFVLPVSSAEIRRWGTASRGQWKRQAARHVTADGTVRSPDLPDTPDPRRVGRILASALFVGRVRECFLTSFAWIRAQPRRGLRLRLVFDAGLPGLAELAALPWELLPRPDNDHFLARDRLTPVARFLDVPSFLAPPPGEPPLLVLVAMANPRGSESLDLRHEEARIREAWGEHPALDVEFLHNVTLDELRIHLRRRPFHVFHFMGHGDVDAARGEGYLLFEDDDGGPDAVPGPLLADQLQGLTSLRLAVLNACHSGWMPSREGTDPYGGVASALALGGLPGVVAMQWPVLDRAAAAFAEHLYRSLAEGAPVEAAVAEGRLAIQRLDRDSFEWSVPTLSLRHNEGSLLEGLVERHSTPRGVREKVHDASELIDAKTRGFVGRGFLFREIEAFLDGHDRGYFLLTGEPGIGKTALIAEMVRRHAWVHHFNSRPAGIYRPEAFLQNLCAQLIVKHRLPHGQLPPEAIRHGGFLVSLLQDISRALAPGQREVLLIDALDETDRDGLPAGVNPLYLPAVLPRGVYAVLSSRPLRDEDMPSLQGPRGEWELQHDSEQNLADARELVESQLGRRGIQQYLTQHALSEGDFVELLADKSAGNFMYLSYILPAIDAGLYDDQDLNELPAGLEEYYQGLWRRMRGTDLDIWLQHKLPVLGALSVIEEPVSIDWIDRLAGNVGRRWVREVLEQWRPFLHVTRRPDEQGRPTTFYRIYHQSFHDFLTGKDEVADERQVMSEAERQVLNEAPRRELEAMLDHLEG